MSTVPGNDHWFDRNCDQTEAPDTEPEVQSGGGPVNQKPGGGRADATVNAVLENLIGQCYPGGEVPAPGKNFIPPEVADQDNSFTIGWGNIYDILRGFNIEPPDISSVYVSFPDDGEGSGQACTDAGQDQGVINCDRPKNPDLEECVKDHLDCIFKPYVGGAWTPPKADCDNFVPVTSFGVSNKICVENCVTPRVAVYEYVTGATDCNAQFTSTNTINLTQAGVVTLELWWDDNPSTAGTAIDSATVGGVTFTRSGEKGREVKSVLLNAGNNSVSYTGTQSYEVTDNYGTNLNVKFKDGDGNDENARLTIISSETSGDHWYSTQTSAPAGYTNNGIKFYGNSVNEARNAVAIRQAYSAQNNDHMLTRDPDGEATTMANYGMVVTGTEFFAFDEKDRMYSELVENEVPVPLYRLYSPSKQDHKFVTEDVGGLIEPDLRNNRYKLVSKANSYLNIDFECRKGSAGYDNTLGWYVTDGIDGNPVYGEVMMPNATDASGKFVTKIPKKIINQYIPCSLGFFIVPDGDDQNSNVEKGDSVTLSDTGNGWRTNLNSAQQNLTFFSQSKFNRDKKDFTHWPNRRWMYWEDLLNGDDDYNDVKVSYGLRYGNSEYINEGVHCWVFAEDAVPVYQEITNQNCGTKIFDGGFGNIELTRTGCGNFSEDERGGSGSGCGKCEGEYSLTVNKVQTITALRSCNLTLRSHGGMTGGRGECLRFQYKLFKNGNQIYADKVRVKNWERIGKVIHSFSVNAGDELTFEISQILAGHYSGRVSPAWSLRDEDAGEFVDNWTANLSTLSSNYNTSVPGQASGRTTEAYEPCGLVTSGSLFAIDPDGGRRNTTVVLTNKVVQNNEMIPPTEYGVQVIKTKAVTQMSAGETGFITTKADGGMVLKLQYRVVDPNDLRVAWSLVEVKDYGKGGYDVGDNIRCFVGSWANAKQTYKRNQYGQDRRRNDKYYIGFRVTDINDLQCPEPSDNQGKIEDIKIDSVFSYQTEPYLDPVKVINNRSTTGNEYKINMNSFFQSLFLYDNNQGISFDTYYRQQKALGNEVIFYQDYRDIRGFKFKIAIRVERIKSYEDGDTYRYPKYGWFGNISVSSASNYGKRYAENDQLNIQYPPARLAGTDGREPQAPYYPKQTELPKDVLVRDRTTGRFKRNARYAIYQDSSNKNSNLWYSNQTVYKPTQYTYLTLTITEVD